MAERIRIKLNQLKIGVPVEYDIFDKQGQLLLKRGAIITSAYQLLQITAHGYCEEQQEESHGNVNSYLVRPSGSHLNPFNIIERCAFGLGQVFFKISQNLLVEKDIIDICRDLSHACSTNPDATIGAVHLLHGHAYTTIHPIHTAAMAYFLCSHLGIGEKETLSILGAALTFNVSIVDLQESLQTQDDPLTPEQKDEIRRHPLQSAEMLRKNGVRDDYWLAIVEQHHERINGTGYPAGLSANDISYGAKIVAVADAYSAMISPRVYRETNLSKDALKTFMLSGGKEFDESLCRLLVMHMGAYPPGTFVNLANGETAIVVRRSGETDYPIVASVKGADDTMYATPVIRDTHITEYGIKCAVRRLWGQKLDLSEIWGYDEE